MATSNPRLDDASVTRELHSLPEWALAGGAITKTYRFADYSAGINFVNKVADIAERLNHHPDMHVGYRKVDVRFTTHDAGGVTKLDLTAAREVEAIHH
jgi:4a-hydroxytetrahydrobiopterin dehydratase